MNKEEYADKFMLRAKQDIKMCENEHELQIYIAGLLDNIDYWQNEYDYMTKDRDTLQQENKQLKERIDRQEFLLLAQGIELKDLYSRIESTIKYLKEPNRDNFDFSKSKLIEMLESDDSDE